MRQNAVTCLVATMLLACASAPAQAATTTVDFDELAPGTGVSSQSGVTFVGTPKVFVPAHVSTYTPPNALHTNGSCSGSTCPSGADHLEITIDHPVGSVSWRVGLDDEPAETEFGDSAELVAYNGSGTPVATSGPIDLGVGSYVAITKKVEAASDHTDIVRAVLTVGAGGVPRRVNVDHLVFTDEVVPVSPPTVQITAPSNRDEFDRADDVRVSGRVTAPAGLLRFCLSTGYTPPTFPTECHGNASLAADGSFTNLRVGPLVTGNNYIAAWVEDRRLRRAGASITIVLRENDLRVTNIEVNQAVQSDMASPTPDDNDVAHSADYSGVPLIADKSTAVRVWTSARLNAAGTPVHGAAVYLYGERADGSDLPGGPIPAIEGTRDIGPSLSFGPLLSPQTRSNANTSWTFLLPYAWQHAGGPVTLRAVVNPPTAYPRVSECSGCGANNTMRLTGVSFRRPSVLHVHPFRVIWRDSSGTLQAPPARPWPTFREAAKVSPFLLDVHPYSGVIDAQSISEDTSLDGDGKTSAIYDRLTDAVDIAGYPGFTTMAVNRSLGPGVTGPHFSWHSFTIRTYEVVNDLRPLTSVAHEMYHAIDFTHAGRSPVCDDAVGRGGAESWPPDDEGRLNSLGADVSSLYAAPRRLTVKGFFDSEGNPTSYYDFMSYCAGEETAWISARNWTRAVGNVASASTASSAAAPEGGGATASAAGATLGVSAEIGEGGSGGILRVEPSRRTPTTPAAGSEVSIRVRNAAGAVVSETPVPLTHTHVDVGHTGSNVLQVSAVVPAKGAASVELVRNGVVLDALARSKSSPKVRVLAPRAGAHVRSKGTLGVRWKSSDADGGRLLSAIDFSINGGRTWENVAIGLRGHSYAVPVSFLSRTRKARVRVRVNDGWNEAGSRSRLFRVDGPPPQVSIESPRNRARIRADEPLNLEGVAYDDRSRQLLKGRLRWFDGRRALGRGSRLTVMSLKPGKHTLRLVARDKSGRKGQASVQVRVGKTTPAFLVLKVPKALKRRARRVTIRAAASLPGTLSIGRSRFKIDRRTRRFRVGVRRGKRPVKLRLVLRAGGRKIRTKLRIPRR
jgi:hypothetical protein